MAKDSTILGNFHKPSSLAHPPNSIGNQQVFEKGSQVGSLEYIPDTRGNLNIELNNKNGNFITKL